MKIIYDLFPAVLTVTSADGSQTGTVDVTRVVLTEEVLVAVVDSPEGPRLVFQEAYSSFDRARLARETSTVTTASGKLVTFRKDESCGCGSRLRSWNPTGAVRAVYSTQEPTE